MQTEISLCINGQIRCTQTDSETPFIYVLREDFGLVGTKAGCSLGQCGACTVLVNGKAERSCLTPTGSLIGSDIVTIEGLAGDTLHPIQQAFIDEQAAQCGYCITGIIMTAAALLKANPKPSLADIKTTLKDNLCRCGTHTRIIRAISKAVTLTETHKRKPR